MAVTPPMNTCLIQVVSVPLAVWLASYAYLALYYRRLNLLKVTIHESGRYNLLQTVFYFNHFLRELFIDTLFVICIYGSYRSLAPGILSRWHELTEAHTTPIATALIAFLGVVFIGSIVKVGVRNTWLDLFQYRELDTVVAYGSHWNMHFLSTAFILLMLTAPATLARYPAPKPLVLTLAAFLLLSLVFRVGKKSVSDKRWLMHGGREILTFFFLGCLPAYIPLLSATHSLSPIAMSASTITVAVALAALTAYIAKVLMTTDVQGLAQGNFGLPYLIASHFFEHTLDFVYMLQLILWLISLGL